MYVLSSLLSVCRVFLTTREEPPKQRVPGFSGYGTTLTISILNWGENMVVWPGQLQCHGMAVLTIPFLKWNTKPTFGLPFLLRWGRWRRQSTQVRSSENPRSQQGVVSAEGGCVMGLRSPYGRLSSVSWPICWSNSCLLFNLANLAKGICQSLSVRLLA